MFFAKEILPPCRAPPCENAYPFCLVSCVQPIALHMLSAIVFHSLCNILSTFHPLFLKHALHGLCLPSFPRSLYSRTAIQLPKQSTLWMCSTILRENSQPPWCIFVSVNLQIFLHQALFAALHPILQVVLRVRRPIEGVIPEF